MKPQRPRNLPRYEAIAHELTRQIEAGVFRPADRLPSIRETAARAGVAINTVKAAYRRLEARGRIEARPRSGYFVCATTAPTPLVPVRAPRAAVRRTATTSELWHEVHAAPRARAAGQGILRLDRELVPSAELARLIGSVLRRFAARCAGDPHPHGEERLRHAIARRYAVVGCTVAPDELLLTTGCSMGIFLSLSALTRPGDAIAVASPFFTSALQLWESLGLSVVEVPAHPEHGIDVAVLERTLSSRRIAACVLVPSFSNPLGSLVPESSRRAIAALAERHDLPVIEDDVFGELPLSVLRPVPIKAFDRSGNVILVSSFSKSLAPGTRVGWLAPGKYYRRIEALKHALGGTPSVATQLALADYLEEGRYDRHLRRVRERYRDRRDRLVAAVTEYFPEGTRVNVPAGGLVLWVELPDGASSWELYLRARDEGIATLPGRLFTLGEGFARGLRLNFSRWDEAVEREIATLGGIAGEIKARS